MVVDSNLLLVETPEEDLASLSTPISREEAEDNIKFLRTQVESWLAVFFNVYGSVGRESRSLIGEVINSWASIAGGQVGQISKYNVVESVNIPIRRYTALVQKLCSFSKLTCPQRKKSLSIPMQMSVT